jgi:hypothetical protein
MLGRAALCASWPIFGRIFLALSALADCLANGRNDLACPLFPSAMAGGVPSLAGKYTNPAALCASTAAASSSAYRRAEPPIQCPESSQVAGSGEAVMRPLGCRWSRFLKDPRRAAAGPGRRGFSGTGGAVLSRFARRCAGSGAQGLGLGPGQVAVEGEEPQPGQQVARDPRSAAARRLLSWSE